MKINKMAVSNKLTRAENAFAAGRQASPGAASSGTTDSFSTAVISQSASSNSIGGLTLFGTVAAVVGAAAPSVSGSGDIYGRLIEPLGSQLHDAWRSPRLKADGTYEPRIKTTKDAEWIAAHGGQNQVDIANTAFAELPADWRGENFESAAVVMNSIRDAQVSLNSSLNDPRGMVEPARIEAMSARVHDAWLERNGSWASEIQKRPYAELPPDEQAKDRDMVLAGLETYFGERQRTLGSPERWDHYGEAELGFVSRAVDKLRLFRLELAHHDDPDWKAFNERSLEERSEIVREARVVWNGSEARSSATGERFSEAGSTMTLSFLLEHARGSAYRRAETDRREEDREVERWRR